MMGDDTRTLPATRPAPDDPAGVELGRKTTTPSSTNAADNFRG
jgi:hypothetical protein